MTSLNALCGLQKSTSPSRNKCNRGIFVLFCVFIVLSYSGPLSAKNNLEELIIWKLSDELKLPAETEKQFSESLRKFNDKKNESSQILEGQVQVLKKITNEKERQLWLDRYRKTLVDFNALILAEHDEVKKVLGNEKFVRYIELKSDLNSRIKNLMLSKEGQTAESKSSDQKNKK